MAIDYLILLVLLMFKTILEWERIENPPKRGLKFERWDLMGNFVEGPRMNDDAPRGTSPWDKEQVMEGEIGES